MEDDPSSEIQNLYDEPESLGARCNELGGGNCLLYFDVNS
jgi:hypothetical protein